MPMAASPVRPGAAPRASIAATNSPTHPAVRPGVMKSSRAPRSPFRSRSTAAAA